MPITFVEQNTPDARLAEAMEQVETCIARLRVARGALADLLRERLATERQTPLRDGVSNVIRLRAEE